MGPRPAVKQTRERKEIQYPRKNETEKGVEPEIARYNDFSDI